MNRILCTMVLGCAVALGACDRFDQPKRPLPKTFTAKTLDGKTLSRADFLGKPWVVNFWVPG